MRYPEGKKLLWLLFGWKFSFPAIRSSQRDGLCFSERREALRVPKNQRSLPQGGPLLLLPRELALDFMVKGLETVS